MMFWKCRSWRCPERAVAGTRGSGPGCGCCFAGRLARSVPFAGLWVDWRCPARVPFGLPWRAPAEAAAGWAAIHKCLRWGRAAAGGAATSPDWESSWTCRRERRPSAGAAAGCPRPGLLVLVASCRRSCTRRERTRCRRWPCRGPAR